MDAGEYPPQHLMPCDPDSYVRVFGTLESSTYVEVVVEKIGKRRKTLLPAAQGLLKIFRNPNASKRDIVRAGRALAELADGLCDM
ncbi:MAG: hypothetical protein G01um1014106_360 [Parcubacteria group bacterium Gr01-1014_106]|nr:MAG: hypothetical protein G01um1014106_360 [Parcubacteria group bacterium Gr01-1014_106]